MKSVKFLLLLSVFCVFLVGLACDGLSQGATQKQQDAASQEEVDWTEDLDTKIDKTMQTLSVIKEELKDYKEEKAKEAKMPRVAPEEESIADKLRGKVKRAARIWKKLKKIVQEEVGDAQKEPGAPQEPSWAQDLDGKLDQAIEAMTVIKEELKEVEEENK